MLVALPHPTLYIYIYGHISWSHCAKHETCLKQTKGAIRAIPGSRSRHTDAHARRRFPAPWFPSYISHA